MRLIAYAAIAASIGLSLSCKTPEAAQGGAETKDWIVTSGDWIIKSQMKYPADLDPEKIKFRVKIRFYKAAYFNTTGEQTTGEMTIKATTTPTGPGTAEVVFDFTPVNERYTLPSFTGEMAHIDLEGTYANNSRITPIKIDDPNVEGGTYVNERFITLLPKIRAYLSNLTMIETPQVALPLTGGFVENNSSPVVPFTALTDSYSSNAASITGKFGFYFIYKAADGVECKTWSAASKALGNGLMETEKTRYVCTTKAFETDQVEAVSFVLGRPKSAGSYGSETKVCKSKTGTVDQIRAFFKGDETYRETKTLDKSASPDCKNLY